MAASKRAHSHLSLSPQYGHTQTHFSIEFPHSTQMANSSSTELSLPIQFAIIKYYKWFDDILQIGELLISNNKGLCL